MKKIPRLVVLAFAIATVVTGCATNSGRPDWQIAFSFEDERSCGHYREVKVFDDGRLDYQITRMPQTAQHFKISQQQMRLLVAKIQEFPVEVSTFADREVRKRGRPADLRLLADEIAKMAGLQWQEIEGPSCEQTHPLPSGVLGVLLLRKDL
jgi:hypothetical protein